MSEKRTFLILHGWGGNKPEHWQELLKPALAADGHRVYAPLMPTPEAPRLAAWLIRLDEEVRSIRDESPLTVVTHSLGAITWMHYVTAVTRRIADRVLLIAPPYVSPTILPLDAPPGIESFFPPPLNPDAIRDAARETHIVASDNDDYATFDQTSVYAKRLDVPIHLLSGAGHISPYWGYGEWPWIFDWCVGNAELPPLPKP